MDNSLVMEILEDPEELKDLEELELSSEIISDISRKRKRHKSKLALPSVENYIECIATERRLLALVRCKDRTLEKNKIVQNRLIKKINRIYKEARSKYENDYELLMDYFHFLKEAKAKIRANEIIEMIMENHSEKEEVWLIAISYYIQHHTPESKIYETISRALTHHSSSKLLFFEAFAFELKSLDSYFKLNGRMNEELFKTFTKHTDLFFNNTDKDIDQYFNVLKKFQNEFQQVKPAKDYFMGKIKELCGDEPAYWENLVKYEDRGATFEEKRTRCIEIYENGIKSLPTNKKSDLWSLYLTFLLDQCSFQDVDRGLSTVDDLKLVNRKFEQAHNERFLTEDMYVVWVELDKKIRGRGVLMEMNSNSIDLVARTAVVNNLEIFEKGLQVYPHSLKLWKAYLAAVINHDNTTNEIVKLFQRAIEAVRENPADLWLLFLSNREQVEENEYIDEIYASAMQNHQVAVVIAKKYLNWTYLNHGIEKCRDVYDALVRDGLTSKDVHKAMLKFEFIEYEVDCERWELVYKRSLEQFPHDIDLWMDYMQFHAKYKKSGKEVVNEVYTKALETLPDSLRLLLRQRVAVDEV